MKIKNKLAKNSLQLLSTMASASLFVMANTTCIGPGYQPKLPKAAEKFKLK